MLSPTKFTIEALSGLWIWLAHFALLYGSASLALQFAGGMTPPLRTLAAIATLLALIGSGALACARHAEKTDLASRLRVMTNVLAIPAVILQFLPVMML